MLRAVLALMVVGAMMIGWGGPGLLAQTDDATEDVHPVVGSWLVEVEVDGARSLFLPNLTSFTGDGIVLVAAPSLLPELPGSEGPVDLFSAGHGAWTASGDDGADVRFVFLVVDAQGRPSSINIIDGQLQVDETGDAYTGEFTLTIVAAAGQSPPPATGTWNATRIAVGTEITATPEADGAEATPVAAEPIGTPAA